MILLIQKARGEVDFQNLTSILTKFSKCSLEEEGLGELEVMEAASHLVVKEVKMMTSLKRSLVAEWEQDQAKKVEEQVVWEDSQASSLCLAGTLALKEVSHLVLKWVAQEEEEIGDEVVAYITLII